MMRHITDTRNPIKVWASDLDELAQRQIRNVAALPFIHSHVAVMPDAHAGKGSTIGTVIATEGAILPAAVGVDIGCGMCALRLPLKADQLGSLGGGNHFIEICHDRDHDVWILLHSGSRNIGLQLAQKHINAAKGVMARRLEALPDPDLALLTEDMPEFMSYVNDLHWAQSYAKANRNEMLLRVVKDVSHHVYRDARLLEAMQEFLRIDCHHNYCQQEEHFGKKVWVTRKGAVSARSGQLGIVPGSMGARSFIVRGRGNPESFHSCAHGAGRRQSRTQARQQFNIEDLARQTAGVECRKDRAVLDEVPEAYKDIDLVMRNQEDLVEIVHELKQLVCVKGG